MKSTIDHTIFRMAKAINITGWSTRRKKIAEIEMIPVHGGMTAQFMLKRH